MGFPLANCVEFRWLFIVNIYPIWKYHTFTIEAKKFIHDFTWKHGTQYPLTRDSFITFGNCPPFNCRGEGRTIPCQKLWEISRSQEVISGYIKSPWNYLALFWEHQLLSLLMKQKPNVNNRLLPVVLIASKLDIWYWKSCYLLLPKGRSMEIWKNPLMGSWQKILPLSIILSTSCH